MENKYPSEVIDLPSTGIFYPIESPLRSGNIEIKYPTAKEEDILSSRNLIQKGIVIDKFLQSLIITPINYDELLIGDKNAILFASRILAYGKDYTVEIECPNCRRKTHLTVDLSAIGNKEIDIRKYFPTGEPTVEFELPNSKITITLKLFTNRDERLVDEELKGLKKMSERTGTGFEMTTRFKHLIIAIDGDRDKARINKFVSEDLLSRDSLAIRSFMQTITPDVDSTFMFSCENSECGEEREMSIPLRVEFFFPSR